MAFYVDTSALAKLVAAEVCSPEMRSWAEGQTMTACDLVRTELGRFAIANGRDPSVFDPTLAAVVVTQLSTEHFQAAGALRSAALLRSLDAIHVVAALALGRDVEGFVTYDQRQARAAAQHSLSVVTPGLPDGWYE
jgi:uncharacterized protein